MSTSHIGDLSRSFVFKAESARLKNQLTQLTQELASGEASDKTHHLKGNLNLISAIEHSLTISETYQAAAQEAKSLAEAQQSVLSHIQTGFAEFSESILAAAQSQLPVAFETLSQQAEQLFGDMVSRLNTTFANRAVFAGDAVESAALEDPSVILANLRSVAAASSSPDAFLTTIDDWFFAPGGDFETLAYLGSTTDLSPLTVAKNQTVSLNQRADDDGFRQVLRDLAVMALSTDNSHNFSTAQLKTITVNTSASAFQSSAEIIQLQANLGLSQGRVEHAMTENAANQTAQSISRNALVAVDPFERSTELQDLQFQMEALYTITARLSRLSLTEYL